MGCPARWILLTDTDLPLGEVRSEYGRLQVDRDEPDAEGSEGEGDGAFALRGGLPRRRDALREAPSEPGPARAGHPPRCKPRPRHGRRASRIITEDDLEPSAGGGGAASSEYQGVEPVLTNEPIYQGQPIAGRGGRRRDAGGGCGRGDRDRDRAASLRARSPRHPPARRPEPAARVGNAYDGFEIAEIKWTAEQMAAVEGSDRFPETELPRSWWAGRSATGRPPSPRPIWWFRAAHRAPVADPPSDGAPERDGLLAERPLLPPLLDAERGPRTQRAHAQRLPASRRPVEDLALLSPWTAAGASEARSLAR